MTASIVEGLVLGSLYALIALGPSLVYGLMKVLDIANAAALTLGAYLALVVTQAFGSLALGVAVAVVAGAALGWLAQRFLYLPILDRGPIVTLITSIGLYMIAGELFRLVFGPLQRNGPGNLPFSSFRVAGIVIEPVDVVVIVLGVGVLLATWWVLSRTRTGIVWRAVAQDGPTASAVGINSKRVIGTVFMLGYGLSALAGVLLAIKYDAIMPTLGDIPAYKMLAIIILGGLGSPLGTIAASLLIGLAETLTVSTIGFVIPRDSIAFIALVIVLLVRPQGLIPSRVVRVKV
ncbi:branched-chain amino acid ABC transporter permease [Intrasporangium sp.]|uniref:branched-chain amino acid ABC transporter permease n=1 Tax=Intrasporangium sp. TaxID=1925024 RepID=UPI003221A8DB